MPRARLSARQPPRDWERWHACRRVLLETYVSVRQYLATRDRAAHWQLVGHAQARGARGKAPALHVVCEPLPGAIQVVEFYHAAEGLSGVAKDLLRDDRAAAETWADAQCSELRKGRLDALLATLKADAGQCTKAAQCEAYIETIRERMRYEDFPAQGLQIDSGVVEAGCKQLSPCGSSRSACTRPRTGQMACRHCALPSSAGATKTSEHDARKRTTQLPPERNRPDPPCAIPRLTVPRLARTILSRGLSIGAAHSLQTCEPARKPARIRIVSCTPCSKVA